LSASEETDRDEAFCQELLRRGWATEEQIAEARRLKAAADELGQPTGVDAILLRKGFVPQERLTVARREVAAKLGQSLRIGKYEILQRLGQGGSGIVYRAFQMTLHREVALKVLTQRREGEEEYIDRFLREAKVAVTLNHVNIVRGLDFGHADGYHYFAMELVDGESLFSLIKKEGRLSESRAIDFALQMVRALEHAAKYRIVHRDIKPENILITKSGTAKLCDLGLARPVIEGGNADAGGRPMGTALYVAPEQIRHEANLDFRADIYSLGGTLFHALTGSPPYSGATVGEIVKAHLSAPVPNPRERVLDISTGAASVVMKMLAKDPADRYHTLESLDEDLESVLDGRPPVNTITIGRKAAGLGEGGAPRATERKPGSKALVPVVVTLSLVAIAGGAWFTFGRSRPEPPPPPPPPPPVSTKGASDFDAGRMRKAREDEAAAAIVAVEAFAAEHGPGAPETEAKYRDLGAAFADTSSGRVANARAETIGKERGERVAAALAQRKGSFDRAMAEGRLGDALAAWSGMPAEVEQGGGRDAAAASRARVEEHGRKILEGGKALAAKAAAGDDAALSGARRAFADAEASGIESLASEAAKEREALEAAVGERVGRLRAAEEAWPRLCADALAASAQGTREAAAVLDQNAALLAPIAPRVAALRTFLDEGAAFLGSIRDGFSKAAADGESLRLRIPGRPGGAVSGRASALRGDNFEIQRGPAVEVVALREVDPEDLAGLAWKHLGAGSPGDHRGAAAFFLSRNGFALAEGEARVLDVLGAKEDAAAVRGVIDTARAAARGRSDAALREAEVLRLQKKLPEARASHEKAVALCPDYPLPLWKLGAFLMETPRDSAEALRLLEAAAALSPSEAEAWYWIGEARRRAGKVEEALTALDRFLGGAPADHPLLEAAKKSLSDLRAASAATAAKQARDEAARAYRKDDFVSAEELWRKVLRFNPEDTESMYFLGKSLLGLDRKVEGYSWLRRFLNTEKKSGARMDDARKTAKELEQRLGDSPAAYRKASEGSGLIDTGKWADSLEVFAAAISLGPLRADTYVERARALQFGYAAESRRDLLTQAVQDLETAILINEKHGRAWSMLAVTRYNLGEYERAVEASARGVALEPAWAAVYQYRALACNKVGKYALAEQAASEGLAKEPKAILYLARAEALCGLGKNEEARKALDAGTEKYDLSPFERAYRSEVLAKIMESEKGK
jgi:serine/threonine protein kinase/tetratricopeptide (TPR) repeat protein